MPTLDFHFELFEILNVLNDYLKGCKMLLRHLGRYSEMSPKFGP